jgi:hypothetical protein
MEKGPEEQPETKLSYWSDRIKEKASEMFV